MKTAFLILALALAVQVNAQTVRDLSQAAQQTTMRDALRVPPLPWAIPDCKAAWDYRDVTLNGTRVMQFNDKSGNLNHLSHSTDGTRAILTTSGAWPQGGVYQVAGSGIALTGNAMTVVYIGREWTSENPNIGTVSGAGTLFNIGSSRPRMNFNHAYSNVMAGGTDFYGPAPIWSPGGAPSIFALAAGTDNTVIYANGNVVTKLAYAANASTLTHVFGESGGFSPMYRPTIAVLVFARKLSMPELAQIASYYGAPIQPAPVTVYAFGSSSIIANKATSYGQGCLQLFADSIGANRGFWGYGGASWNGTSALTSPAGALAAANTLYVHKGQRSIHVLMPQHNDLAAHVAVATCETAITDTITRIRGQDPFAWFILAPVTPRRASFSGGQTDADFDVDRLDLNSRMVTIANASVGVVCADAMSVAEINDQADANNTTYFDADTIHMKDAGHVLYAQSLFRAWVSLNQGN